MTQRLKILYLITELDVGGAERNLCRLTRDLHWRGYEVQVAALDGRGPLAEELKSDGIPLWDLGMRRKMNLPFVLARLVGLLRKLRPDILHSFLFHANIVGRLAGALSGVPGIISSVRVAERRRLSHLALDWATQWLCDVELAVSQSVAEFTRSRAFISEKKLRVIPNATDLVDREIRAANISALYPQAENAKVLLFVGRLERQKGVDILLKAFKRVLAAQPLALLVVMGEGPDQPALRVLSERLGIGSKVIFVGWRKDVPEWMAASLVVVLASRWEGMPNVLIEAAALGRPVVATDVEGVREVVIDGRTGFVTPCYDPASFAQACLRLLSNPMLCEKMGQEAKRHARAVFSPSHHVEMVLNLYAELLTKKGFATADL